MTTNALFASTLRNTSGNWITGTVGTFKVQAKAFAEPSQYGMPEDARISKLWVALPGTPQIELYNYDRGLNVNHLTDEGLTEIVAAVAKAIK